MGDLGAGTAARLIVNHDDATREYAYDRGSPIGRLERGLDEAPRRGWTVQHEERLEEVFPSSRDRWPATAAPQFRSVSLKYLVPATVSVADSPVSVSWNR